jgi:hypothetical protein
MASEPINERDPNFHHPLERLYAELGFVLISIYRNPELNKDHIDSDISRLRKNNGDTCAIITFRLGNVARIWAHPDANSIELHRFGDPRVPMPTIAPPARYDRETLTNIRVVEIPKIPK